MLRGTVSDKSDLPSVYHWYTLHLATPRQGLHSPHQSLIYIRIMLEEGADSSAILYFIVQQSCTSLFPDWVI